MYKIKPFSLLLPFLLFFSKLVWGTEEPLTYSPHNHSYNIHNDALEKVDKKEEISPRAVAGIEKKQLMVTKQIEHIEKYIAEQSLGCSPAEIANDLELSQYKEFSEELKKFRSSINESITQREIKLAMNRIRQQYLPADDDGI